MTPPPPSWVNSLVVRGLNVYYKIATKEIAKRLQKVLPDIINRSQTGYTEKEDSLEKIFGSLKMYCITL